MVISKVERLRRELESAIRISDMDLALAVCDDLIDLDPEISEFHVSKGVILAKIGRIAESIEEIDEAITLNKEDQKAWYSKGCILMDNGKVRPALGCFYKSLDLDPNHVKSTNRFLRCLELMRQEDRARDDLTGGIYHDGPSLVSEDEKPVFNATFEEEEDEDEEDEYEDEAPDLPDEAPDLPRRRKKGSLLDDDLFDDEEDEEWGEFDEDEDEEFEEDEEDDEEDDWDDFDEDEEVPVGFLDCRCGGSIPIYSNERPYRFECPDCGRTGKLK